MGFFSPHSWQPLSLAIGGALAFLGIIFGWWLLYFASPIILVGLFGWVFEYYRGENQRTETARRPHARAEARTPHRCPGLGLSV